MSKEKIIDIADAKPKRTLKEIQDEYMQVCSDAGNAQYNMLCLQTELNQKNEKLNQLSIEAREIRIASETAPVEEKK